jgi:hypothetical protein
MLDIPGSGSPDDAALHPPVNMRCGALAAERSGASMPAQPVIEYEKHPHPESVNPGIHSAANFQSHRLDVLQSSLVF